MNVWLIKIGEPLPIDTASRPLRTSMLAQKLVQRGHRVLWWTSSFDHHKKRMLYRDDQVISVAPSYEIVTIKGCSYSKNVSLRRYLDHLIIARKFARRAIHYPRPDVIVCSMPDYQLASKVVTFANENQIPVLVDIRDKWPDFLWEIAPEILRPLIRLGLVFDRSKLAYTLSNADGLVSVSRSWLEWGLRYAERKVTSNDQVFYLGAPEDNWDRDGSLTSFQRSVQEMGKGKCVVSYIGSFSRIHSPEIMLCAARKIISSPSMANRILFVLAGDGPLRKKLLSQSRDLPNVVMPGWLKSQEIDTLLSISSIGVVPTPFDLDLFPNKAFSFFQKSIPILTSMKGDLKDLLSRYQAGYWFPPHSVVDLTQEIQLFLENPVLLQQTRENVKKLYESFLGKTSIYDQYVDHVEKLVEAFK